MAQSTIVNYYGKRKFVPDGEVHSGKAQLVGERKNEGDGVFSNCKARRVIAKLTFGEDDAEAGTARPARRTPNVRNVQNKEDAKRVPSVPFKKLGALSPVKKDLPIAELKKAISKSSRLAELKTRISSFNDSYAKLVDPSATVDKEKAGLKQFSSIEIPVPVSPIKQASPFTSPVKGSPTSLRSPFKSPSKVPAHERYASLIATSPSLTLPHHYRWLGEVFRAIDTACSLLYNRRETVTFMKIKPAAQEMLKRNVTEKHLAQIIHLSPNMYKFTREKVRNFGTSSKKEEYDLVVVPKLISQVTGSPVDTMTSDVILERRRSFYNMLIEKVKDHHDNFLAALDPPMTIPRNNLKSWHPQFDLERIPDVDCEELPASPNVEKYSTAKDVLSKARELFDNNPRIEKALRRIAEAKAKENDENEGVQGNETPKPMTVVEAMSEDISILNPALKNLPESLLQKVRARQAEKALQTMTRTLTQNKNILLYQRLPEFARIVRNLFVTEKKFVLPLEMILSKLDGSFRSKLSNTEFTNHLMSLSKEVPEFITLIHIRKTDYVKLSKITDFTCVMNKLEALANKHLD